MVGAEPGLDASGRVILPEHLVPHVPRLSHEALDVRLDHHQPLAFPVEFPALLVATPDSLDVDDEVLLGVGQHHVGVPPLLRVYSEQVLHYYLKPGVASHAGPVYVGGEHFVSEGFLVTHVEGVLSCHYLVHSDPQ